MAISIADGWILTNFLAISKRLGEWCPPYPPVNTSLLPSFPFLENTQGSTSQSATVYIGTQIGPHDFYESKLEISSLTSMSDWKKDMELAFLP